jgi:hypothetical protein
LESLDNEVHSLPGMQAAWQEHILTGTGWPKVLQSRRRVQHLELDLVPKYINLVKPSEG